ncbi:Cytochrome P450 monooxygenase CLM2 [Cladobotryum mycophilum]|uniref:Cytochrome P450 monooxygenase CLM2 n=1 Tax=Cladobotryum mycophilum TaxID=491253 RepID=A0ABR0SPU0_9HYPO
MASTLLIQGIIALIGFIVYRQVFRKSNKKLPPGPKGLPLVGNVLDLPPSDTPDHEFWMKLNDKYGPISSITVLGQTMVFLHDREAVYELLEKRSLKTSNRPVIEFANYSGFGKLISLLQLDTPFKQQRKFMHQALGTKSLSAKFADIQQLEARRLLLRALEEPDNMVEHINKEAAGIILKMVYDYTIEPRKPDPLVDLIDHMMANAILSSVPFYYLIEFIPSLKHLPDWFPGTGFKKIAKTFRKEIRDALTIPFEFSRKLMTTQNRMKSYVATMLQGNSDAGEELSAEDLSNIRYSALALYGGGADTTVTTLVVFILAMIKFPGAQRRAQEEIDRVTGGTRLPTLEDKDNMPFVEAVVWEALRWWPILPTGVPHALSEDMTYNGYDLPKGTYIFPGIWYMTHDPKVYSDPDSFDPARFLAPRNELDPRGETFGYGRRVCPGRYFADTSLFLAIAHLLTVFNFEKKKDEQGNVMEPNPGFQKGAVSKPTPFPYKVVPRSEKHVEMIRSIEEDHPWEESDGQVISEALAAAQ